MLYIFEAAQGCDFFPGVKLTAKQRLCLLNPLSVHILYWGAAKVVAEMLDKTGLADRAESIHIVHRQCTVKQVRLQIADGGGNHTIVLCRAGIVSDVGQSDDSVKICHTAVKGIGGAFLPGLCDFFKQTAHFFRVLGGDDLHLLWHIPGDIQMDGDDLFRLTGLTVVGAIGNVQDITSAHFLHFALVKKHTFTPKPTA